MENSPASGKSRISNQTKFRQFVRRIFLGPFARVVGTLNDLTRSRPYYEGSKSEIRGVGEGIGGSKRSCRGCGNSVFLHTQSTFLPMRSRRIESYKGSDIICRHSLLALLSVMFLLSIS
ncbi:hypothetical protein AVEN_198502-1 [Araneus ventricosus]|uniref:Uncharacterized protein n=1 Tax=Araneus ventricosus TaxID=182803 RepID=A0A4Y2X332_ARAVE|nr:hypothetical protein AVEN_198502-1 [Araneus ventricosus]